MFHGNALYEGLLDEVLELRRELGPVSGDLLAEEDSGKLANIRSFGGTKVLNKSRYNLRILSQSLNLLFGLPSSVVVRHQELNQQQFQRLSHWFQLLLLY